MDRESWNSTKLKVNLRVQLSYFVALFLIKRTYSSTKNQTKIFWLLEIMAHTVKIKQKTKWVDSIFCLIKIKIIFRKEILLDIEIT